MEPATSAKVALTTTKGDLEIELWAKECPLSVRTFIENCIAQRYTNKCFDIEKGKLIQLQSIEDQEYNIKNEFSSRLKFDKRGMVGIVNDGTGYSNRNSCASIFITVDSAPQLNYNYTLIGKIVGDSYYNVTKIHDSEMENGKPIFPIKVIDSRVPVKYFDIDESQLKPEEPIRPATKIRKTKGNKIKLNYDDEEHDSEDKQDFKMKSAYDLMPEKMKVKQTQKQEQGLDEANGPINDSISTENIDNNSESKSFPEDSDTKIEESAKDKVNIVEDGSAPPNQSTTDVTSTGSTEKTRDPTIDSDSDSEIDISSDIEIGKVRSHKYVIK